MPERGTDDLETGTQESVEAFGYQARVSHATEPTRSSSNMNVSLAAWRQAVVRHRPSHPGLRPGERLLAIASVDRSEPGGGPRGRTIAVQEAPLDRSGEIRVESLPLSRLPRIGMGQPRMLGRRLADYAHPARLECDDPRRHRPPRDRWAGLDGIVWGYRIGHTGLWAYYPIDHAFIPVAVSATELVERWTSGDLAL